MCVQHFLFIIRGTHSSNFGGPPQTHSSNCGWGGTPVRVTCWGVTLICEPTAAAPGGEGICANDHYPEWRVSREEPVCPPLYVVRVYVLPLPLLLFLCSLVACDPLIFHVFSRRPQRHATVDGNGDTMTKAELDATPRSVAPAAPPMLAPLSALRLIQFIFLYGVILCSNYFLDIFISCYNICC